MKNMVRLTAVGLFLLCRFNGAAQAADRPMFGKKTANTASNSLEAGIPAANAPLST